LPPDAGLALSTSDFRPEEILKVLHGHGVRFVLVGGYAAVVYGSPYVTTDIDVVPERSEDNLARLSDALDELHAKVWSIAEPAGVPFGHGGRSLGDVRVWNLVTDHGRLDLTFEPSGTTGYPDLSKDAITLDILGVEVDVASLRDIIRSKEAAGRAKDRLVLPTLRDLLDEFGDTT
jgi:predicted nucleotidyltransferase